MPPSTSITTLPADLVAIDVSALAVESGRSP
jgi:hypothetical protein